MKEQFEPALIEIIIFNSEDIIVTSGNRAIEWTESAD